MRRVSGFVLLIGLFLLVSCSRPGQNPTPTAPPLPTATIEPTATVIPAGIYIDPTTDSHPISPLVYGTNYGPWLVVTVDVQDEFADSGLTYLRFPGGRYGDTFDMHGYQIDQLMDLAAIIDAEVTISVRLLGGSPEDAAEIVRYTNLEKEYGVTYWSIGNEPSLYGPLQDEPEWDTIYFNEQWRQFAEAMLAVDPNIQILGPNIHQISADPAGRPKDDAGRDWLSEFLIANGDLVDVVTFHRYPFPQSNLQPVPTFDELRDNSREWDTIIPAVRQTVREITGEDKPLGVMEINSNYTDVSGFDTSPDSYFNAVWWADVLGRLINQRVDMVTHFALQNRTSGWGMLGRTEARPTYYVYQLYQRFGNELLFSQSDDPYVSVVAARRGDGTITVMLTNLTDEPVTKPLTIIHTNTSITLDTWQLTEEALAENIGSQSVGDSVTLPGRSVTLLIFEGN